MHLLNFNRLENRRLNRVLLTYGRPHFGSVCRVYSIIFVELMSALVDGKRTPSAESRFFYLRATDHCSTIKQDTSALATALNAVPTNFGQKLQSPSEILKAAIWEIDYDYGQNVWQQSQGHSFLSNATH